MQQIVALCRGGRAGEVCVGGKREGVIAPPPKVHNMVTLPSKDAV